MKCLYLNVFTSMLRSLTFGVCHLVGHIHTANARDFKHVNRDLKLPMSLIKIRSERTGLPKALAFNASISQSLLILFGVAWGFETARGRHKTHSIPDRGQCQGSLRWLQTHLESRGGGYSGCRVSWSSKGFSFTELKTLDVLSTL